MLIHAICGEEAPYCSKTFLATFKKQQSKVGNFSFTCDVCLTKNEHKQAADVKDLLSEMKDDNDVAELKEQISKLVSTVGPLVKTVNHLANEMEGMKNGKIAKYDNTTTGKESSKRQNDENQNELKANNEKGTSRINDESVASKSSVNRKKIINTSKSTLCIRSNGSPIDIEKVQDIAVGNSIQVSKTVVSNNGDLYVHCPTHEVREKLTPLLVNNESIQNEIVEVKSKLPTITILGVTMFNSKDKFLDKVKKQNPKIKEKIEEGDEFNIVYVKKPNESPSNRTDVKTFQIVASVSNDIRKIINAAKDRGYIRI